MKAKEYRPPQETPAGRGFPLVWAVLLAALALAEVHSPASAGQEEPVWRRNLSIEMGGFLSNYITALGADENRLWVGTDTGLVWSADNGRSWQRADIPHAKWLWAEPGAQAPPPEAGAWNYVTCILVTRRSIWVGTRGGLFVAGVGQGYRVGGRKGLEPGAIWGMASRDNRIWLVGLAGVLRSDDNGARWIKVSPAAEQFWAGEARASESGPWQAMFTRVAISQDAAWLSPLTLQQEPGKGFAILKGSLAGESWQLVWFGTHLESRLPPLSLNCIRAYDKEIWLGTSLGIFTSDDEGVHWRHFTTANQLPSEQVLDIFRVGRRTWAATANGLCYTQDGGKRWVSGESPKGRMTCLTADPLALWVGTEGGLLRRLGGGQTWESYSSRREVRAIAIQKVEDTTRWWVGTRGGLCLSSDRGRSWRVFTVADRLPSNVINDIAVDGRDVWVATDGGIALRGADDEYWRRYGSDGGLLSGRVSSIAAAEGTVWAATGRGLSRLDRNARQFRTFRQLQSWEHVAFDGRTLLAATRDWSQGDLIQQARNSLEPVMLPLFRFVKLGVEGWDTVFIDGYKGGMVHDVLLYGNTFWVVSDAGLFKSRDGGRSWARYTSESLWAPCAACLCPYPAGGLMVQSALHDPEASHGVWSVTQTGGKEWFTLKPRLPAIMTTAASDGQAVIAGGPAGLYVLAKAGIESLIPGRPGRLAFHVMALLAASHQPDGFRAVAKVDPHNFHNPTVWLGMQGQGILERSFPLGEVVFRAAPQSLAGGSGPVSDNILSIAAEPDGVWFGTDKGVSVYDRIGTWRSYLPAEGRGPAAPPEAGLRGGQVRGVARLGNEMWFGTEAGCNALDVATGRWRLFDASNSPLPQTGVSCLEAQADLLWVGTSSGLYRYLPPNDWQDVVKGADVLCLASGRNLVCAGTDRGLFVVDRAGHVVQRLDSDNSALPANRVERLVLDGPDVWASAGEGFTRLDLVTPLENERAPETPSDRGPAGVLVVINENSPDSVRVGEYYAEARHIPPGNLCAIKAPLTETISRETYDRDIRAPIARHLLRNGLSRRISFIVTTYGVPLRIAPTQATADLDESPLSDRASVDSELTLLSKQYPVDGSLPNLYLHRAEPFDSTRFGMYLVTRLDGPTPESAMKLVERALRAEEERSLGMAGTAYVECGGVDEEKFPRVVDAIRANHHALEWQVYLKRRVTLAAPLEQNEGEEFLGFFYMGWPPEGARRPRFSWCDGSVAVAMTPLSAWSLREPSATPPAGREASWCKTAIEEGVSAALGNCYNPTPSSMTGMTYLFRYLNNGYLWAECAYMSLRYLSWQHVVVGDPLYRPFQ
jgi:uncharacterized protein (TIGR03790 family)